MRVIDLHCDTVLHPFMQRKEGKDFNLYSNDLAIDIKKLRKGDYLAQFFAIFVPGAESLLNNAGIHNPDYLKVAQEMVDIFHKSIKDNNKDISLARNIYDLEKNRDLNKISAFLTLEGADYLNNDLNILHNFFDQGVRLISLSWNYETCVGYPNSEDPKIMNLGLKPFGIELVKEMNDLGIIIDVSHLSDAGFYDCLKYSTKPIIASHSNSRVICNHPRNLTDKMLKALADSGGITGLNFCSSFLKQGEPMDGKSTIADMILHLKHIKNVAGSDVIALGTDFDGIDSNVEIQDASQVYKLCDAMAKSGFSSTDIDKFSYQNTLQIIKDVL